MKDQSPIKFLMIRFAKQESGLKDGPSDGFNSKSYYSVLL